MSRFDHLDRIASASVDQVLGEPFTLTPMRTEPNGRPVPDPDRLPISGRGVFSLRDFGGARTFEMRTLPPTKTPVVSVDRRAFGGQAPQQGDVLDLPERGRRYEVVRVAPDGGARWLLRLTAS